MKISKEEFVKAMEQLDGFYKENTAFNNAMFPFTGQSTNFGLGNDLAEYFLKFLQDLCGDQHEWIDWWVWEANFGRKPQEVVILDRPGQPEVSFTLKNSAQMYDLLVDFYSQETVKVKIHPLTDESLGFTVEE